MIHGKKHTILALRVCAMLVTGLLLWGHAPAGDLRGVATLAWSLYAGATVAIALLPAPYFADERFNAVYVASEFVLLGLFFGVFRGGPGAFFPLFLLTVLGAALSRRLVIAILLGLGASLAHVFMNLDPRAGPAALGVDTSTLILEAAILLTTSGLVGYLTEEIERQDSTGELLDSALQVSSLLTGNLDLGTVYERVTYVLAHLFRAGRVAVIQAQPGWAEGRILCAVDRGEHVGELTIQLDRYPEIMTALERRETVIVGDVRRYPELHSIRNRRLKNAAILVAPIDVQGTTRGVIFVRLEDHRGGFTMRQVTFCRLLANATAQAIAHSERIAEIQRAAFVDPLTGLENLRSFHARLEEEMERAERTTQPLSLMMIDIDYLKHVNDAHGHLAGDEILKQVALRLRDEVRDIDLVARYGGEEFAVMLVGTDSWRGDAVAERIREQIEALHVERVGGVTVSIGIAAYPQDANTPRELVHRADQALYFSKYRGRNRVTLYDSLHRQVGEKGIESVLLEAFTSVSLERHLDHADPRILAVREHLIGFGSSRELVEQLDEVILSLTAAMETKDSYTREHLEAVTALSALLLDRLPIDDEERRLISIACLLHDIGKLGIREDILQKAEFLTREEYEIVRRHPVIGAQIIEPLRALKPVAPYIRHHHERWDGKGYPDGLAGDRIPLGARVVGIIDAFHAMVSRRPYYQRMRGLRYACDEIRRNAGSQFDPELALEFLASVEQNAAAVEKFVARDPDLVLLDGKSGIIEDDRSNGARLTRPASDPSLPHHAVIDRAPAG